MRNIGLLSFLVGCGPALECGRGTIEVDGECVVDPSAPDDTDPTGTPTTDTDPPDVTGPHLVVTPDVADLADVPVPCDEALPIVLSNDGDVDLEIVGLELDAVEGRLSVDLPQLPVVIEPGASAELSLRFAAPSVGADTGELVVTSNDPRGLVTVGLSGNAVYGPEVVDVYEVTGAEVDVMLLIDQSCSMEEDNVDDVTNGIPAFVAALTAAADWRMMEITNADGCANEGILDATTPDVEGLLIEHAFDDPLNPYAEALLQHATTALELTAAGACNEGFLRPDAALHVVVVSDEPEQSNQPYTFHLANLQGYAAEVVVSAVVDVNENCGDTLGGGGYIDAAEATGGVVLNICNANWGANMATLADAIIDDGSRSVVLSRAPYEDSIEVRVDGVATPDWTWDPAAGAVVVEDLAVGATVEVSYAVPAECAP